MQIKLNELIYTVDRSQKPHWVNVITYNIVRQRTANCREILIEGICNFIIVGKGRNTRGDKSLCVYGQTPSPKEIRESKSLSCFQNKIATHAF